MDGLHIIYIEVGLDVHPEKLVLTAFTGVG
jgi:hypothetical protein